MDVDEPASSSAGYPTQASGRGRWRKAPARAEPPGAKADQPKAVLTRRQDVLRTAEQGAEDWDDEAPLPPRTRPRQFPRPQAPIAAPEGLSSVCVVGGGPAGLGCCKKLCDAGLQVTLVQESRGLGGKMCTKFVNGPDDPALHFDMGVQLLWPDGPLRKDLEGVVAPWPAPGRFKRVVCTGDWRRWQLRQTLDLPTEGYVVGVPSMSKIGRHLASKCEGLEVHIDRTGVVRGRDPQSGQWEVEWKRASPTGNQLKYRPELKDVPTEVGRGSFDAVVLAFEANKVLRGCKSGYKMVQSSATPEINRRIRGKAHTSQCWNLMIAFDQELPMPWDAATIEGHPSLAWVAVNSSKPERARVPQCFMALTTQEWADWKQWGRQEVERVLQDEVLGFLEQVLGRRPPKPCFVLGGRWGNNTDTVLTKDRRTGEFPMCALGYHEGSAPVVWDGPAQMGATGDWTRGFSVSDAYRAGEEMASAVLSGDRAMGG